MSLISVALIYQKFIVFFNRSHIVSSVFQPPVFAVRADFAINMFYSLYLFTHRPPAPVTGKPGAKCDKNKYKSNKYCGLIADKKGAFAKCIAATKPDEIKKVFDLCVFDMCRSGKTKVKTKLVCDNLDSFAQTCAQKGHKITGWRKTNFCRK